MKAFLATTFRSPILRARRIGQWQFPPGHLLLAGGLIRAGGAHKSCVRDAIEAWLKLGRVKPTIDDLTIGLTWTGADLFGELAVQIALAAKALDGQVLCVACGKAYQPKRLVIRRGFNYCPKTKCQRQAAAVRAKRYRDRKKSPEREHGRGLPYRGVYGGTTNDSLFSQ